MPFHKCPFCILKPEYGYIGFAMYGFLFVGAHFGMSVAVTEPLRLVPGLEEVTARFQRRAVSVSLVLLLLFVAVSSYHYLRYLLIGGQG